MDRRNAVTLYLKGETKMKKFWNLIKDMSMLFMGIGYALTWVLNKLAKGDKAKKFKKAESMSYALTIANGIIYLIS